MLLEGFASAGPPVATIAAGQPNHRSSPAHNSAVVDRTTNQAQTTPLFQTTVAIDIVRRQASGGMRLGEVSAVSAVPDKTCCTGTRAAPNALRTQDDGSKVLIRVMRRSYTAKCVCAAGGWARCRAVPKVLFSRCSSKRVFGDAQVGEEKR